MHPLNICPFTKRGLAHSRENGSLERVTKMNEVNRLPVSYRPAEETKSGEEVWVIKTDYYLIIRAVEK